VTMSLTFIAATLVLALTAGAAGEPQPPVVLRQESPVGIAVLPGGGYAFYDRRQPEAEPTVFAPDGKAVKLEPRAAFGMPVGPTLPECVLLGRDGELHEVFMKLRGEGRKLAVDRFIDLWHRPTRGGKARWEEPKLAWEGYTGAVMMYGQLSTGRIVVPFGKWVPNRPTAPPTGSSVSMTIYSDDDGATWHQSPSELTSPCFPEYNGSNYGACEPVIVETKRADQAGRHIWMVMRTQAGFLYESWSRDGAEWTPAVPSRFHSSNGPSGILRLADGRIVLFWNHCELPPRADGQGVYGGRDALHAAISDDEGRTWRGFREVYRDAHRNETPPRSGDRGTAYPFPAYTKDAKILLYSGQGAGRRNFVLVDPDWLTQTRAADDFANGLDGWHVFKAFGPAERWWRDRTVGPVLINHPSKPGAKALHVRRPDDMDPDGAVWNFPLGWKGKVTVRLLLRPGLAGGSIALGDRCFDPCDDNGERLAIFRMPLRPDGPFAPDKWHTVTMAWDLSAKRCELRVDDPVPLTLPQAHEAVNGISYLRLRSTATAPDRAGFLVESVAAEISDPVAPPRTPEQNHASQAQYLTLIEGFRNRTTTRK